MSNGPLVLDLDLDLNLVLDLDMVLVKRWCSFRLVHYECNSRAFHLTDQGSDTCILCYIVRYRANIALYSENITLYTESIMLHGENILLYTESVLLYGENISVILRKYYVTQCGTMLYSA